MPECAVCSSPASNKCARCKCVFYCSPAHQKEDWPAHRVHCPRLAQEALATVFHPCDEELLLRITTCLAQNGYHKEVGIMVQLNKAFWNDEQIWDAYKDVPGPSGKTRLIFASVRGRLSRVKRLLARGARVNTPQFSTGTTALMGASMCGHLAVVRELILQGANVNAAKTDPEDERGYTALMLASFLGYFEVVQELCAKGADVNARLTSAGQTSLMCASQEGKLSVVRELLARGADVHAAITEEGTTALIMAAKSGHVNVARELIDHGASANSRTSDTYTALMWATLERHLDVAQLLLQKGADKSATNVSGETAWDLSITYQLPAFQALLRI